MPSLSFILSSTLVLGYSLLIDFPKGNDTTFHLSYVYYIDRYFPHISQWFYKEGSGYPFLAAYPPVSYYIIYFAHLIFSVGILDSCKIVALASTFSAGVGIYLLVRARFENERMAVVSAFLYLITPANWASYVQGGLLPQQIALPFTIFALFFVEQYEKTSRRGYLAMTSLCVALAVLTHTFVGLIITPIMLVGYLAAKALSRQISLKKAAYDIGKVGILSLLLTAFWLVPFFTVFGAGGGRKEYVPSELSFLSLRDLLGIRVEHGMWRLSTIVMILTPLGIVAAARKRGIIIWLGAFSGLLLFLSMAPGINAVFGSMFFFLYQYADAWRYSIPALILLPVVAGFGVTSLGDRIVQTVSKRSRHSMGRISKTTSFAIASLAILSLSYLLNPLSWNLMQENYEWKGQSVNYATVMDIVENATRGSWGNYTRIDMSPWLSPAMECFTILSDVSQENAYFFPGTGWRAYGYKQALLYGTSGGRTEVRTLARWFGTQYVILTDLDPAWKFQDNGFTEIWRSDEAFEKRHTLVFNNVRSSLHILRFNNAAQLVTAKNVPTVLVIGSREHETYETVFQTSVMAGIDSESSYVIQGSGFIDDYSLEELKTFDAILLHGYNYRDSTKAWTILNDYVTSGGGLFIETGWQYISRDWNSSNIPSPCPVSKTLWTNYGKEWHLSQISSPVTNGINFTSFSPPVWENLPWSFSSTNNESVRDWAKPVLWNDGYPLIVIGEYGKGKVAWSGMNLISHASSKYNYEELKLFSRILGWISSRNAADVKYEISRPTPDKVIVSVHDVGGDLGVLFREVNYPGWHAYVKETGTRLQIYNCGPNFMYAQIPAGTGSSYSIVFEYEKSLIEWGSILVSATTFFLLTVGYGFYQAIISRTIGKLVGRLTGWWHKEE